MKTTLLEYRDVPVPEPDKGDVLLQVLAAGANNTEINTRLGCYSDRVAWDTVDMVEHNGKASRRLCSDSRCVGSVESTTVQLAKRRSFGHLGHACTFPLENIVETQERFVEKKHVGKVVLIPPSPGEGYANSLTGVWDRAGRYREDESKGYSPVGFYSGPHPGRNRRERPRPSIKRL